MCGRYTLRRANLIAAAMQAMLQMPELDEYYIGPRFNVAPSQEVPIVRREDRDRVLDHASWGFVPSWTKEKPKAKPINARCETVASSGMFRSAFRSSRCLLPADGFYEWKAGTPKRPYFFHRPDDGIFAFAGLWSRWQDQTTCLLLTTTPNAIVRPVHDRMPVILKSHDYAKWLDPATTADELAALLRPYPEKELIAQAATTRVNKPSNDDALCVSPDPDHGN